MAIIQGDLSEYALPDLLQFMHGTRKVGQLVLEGAGAAPAGVFFAAGEVVHAYCPQREGVPALQNNGRRTLEDVLHQANGADDDAARIVHGLLTAGLVTTARDDGWLEAIVPERVPVDEAAPSRAAPPTILANLVVHKVNGKRSLRAIRAELGCGERALADELHLLVRTGWIRFRAGEDLYRRYLGG